MTTTQEAVRDRYRSAALRMAENQSCCGTDCCAEPSAESSCGATYPSEELAQIGVDSSISLGFGNPLLLADLQPGEVVLDLGSGGGLDVLLSVATVEDAGGEPYSRAPNPGLLSGVGMNGKKLASCRTSLASFSPVCTELPATRVWKQRLRFVRRLCRLL